MITFKADPTGYGKYFTTRCPSCKHRMEWRDCKLWGGRGRYQFADMCCHRCKHNWKTRDELALSGGIIYDVERTAYNPPDGTLWIED